MSVDHLFISAEKRDVELLRSCLTADRKTGNNALDFKHSDTTSLVIGKFANGLTRQVVRRLRFGSADLHRAVYISMPVSATCFNQWIMLVA